MDTTIYKTIINHLLELISRNAGTPNSRLPSERMLAMSFNASRKPVRHAYEDLIARGYVTRIHGSGYYISDGLKPERIQNDFHRKIRISFIIPAVSTQYAHSLLSGVSDFCAEKKVDCSIHVSDGVPEKENALLRSARQAGSMGIILFPIDNETFDHSELTRLAVQKFPLVLVDRRVPNFDTSFVASDDHRSLIDAVQFLYRRGFRSPVYVTPPPRIASSVDSRINGFTHGLLKYYKIASPGNLLILGENGSLQKNAVAQHLKKYPETDVMIIPGNKCTPILAGIRAAEKDGVKLMVFDDELSHSERELIKPYYILQDGYRIGYVAAETLYNHILGDTRSSVRLLPVSIADADGNSLSPQQETPAP